MNDAAETLTLTISYWSYLALVPMIISFVALGQIRREEMRVCETSSN